MNSGHHLFIVSVTGAPTVEWISAEVQMPGTILTITADIALIVATTTRHMIILPSAITHRPTPHGQAATGISIAIPAEHS